MIISRCGFALQIISSAARTTGVDFVLVDLNPNMNTLNRNVIMSSSYIVLTTRPDDFSHENINTVLDKIVGSDNNPTTCQHGGSWMQQMRFNIREKVNRELEYYTPM